MCFTNNNDHNDNNKCKSISKQNKKSKEIKSSFLKWREEHKAEEQNWAKIYFINDLKHQS